MTTTTILVGTDSSAAADLAVDQPRSWRGIATPTWWCCSSDRTAISARSSARQGEPDRPLTDQLVILREDHARHARIAHGGLLAA